MLKREELARVGVVWSWFGYHTVRGCRSTSRLTASEQMRGRISSSSVI